MNKQTVLPLRAGVATAIALALAPSLVAQEKSNTKSPEWSFELSAGVEQDSNVSVNELDASTGNDDFAQWLMLERHACIDTTAAGGNVALLGG